MVRGIAAVIAGYVIMAAIVMAGTFALVAAFVPGGVAAMRAMRDNPAAMPKPSPRYYSMNIALSLVAAIVGGWVAAQIAGPAPRGYVISLAVVVLAMGLVSGFAPGSRGQATWYKLAIPLIGALGVAIGGGIAGA